MTQTNLRLPIQQHDTRYRDNPHLPMDTIGLRAFNLMPGATFMLIDQPDPRVWVAQKVHRDSLTERVMVWARDGRDEEGDVSYIALNLDYCTLVALIGLVVNHDDECDNDWGAND